MNNDIDNRAISKLYGIIPRTDIDYLQNRTTEVPPIRSEEHAKHVGYCMVAGIVCHSMADPTLAFVAFAVAVVLVLCKLGASEFVTTQDHIITIVVFAVVTGIYLLPMVGITDWYVIIVISVFGAIMEYALIILLYAFLLVIAGE